MEQEFMGLFIGSMATIFGIASIISTIIIKPVINLNKTITKLNVTIESLNDKNETLNKRVFEHEKEMNDVQKHLIKHDADIEYLKKGTKNELE